MFFSVSVDVVGTNDVSRVLIALNAMIPETATTCKSRTISNARDNFMFGSGMSSKSIPPEVADARRAAVASSFLCLKSCGIFIALFWEGLHERAKLIASVGVALKHVKGRRTRGK